MCFIVFLLVYISTAPAAGHFLCPTEVSRLPCLCYAATCGMMWEPKEQMLMIAYGERSRVLPTTPLAKGLKKGNSEHSSPGCNSSYSSWSGVGSGLWTRTCSFRHYARNSWKFDMKHHDTFCSKCVPVYRELIHMSQDLGPSKRSPLWRLQT